MSDDDQNGVHTEEQRGRICPFLVEPLNRDDTLTPNDYPLRPLFPASYRTASDDLAASTRDIAACVQTEFDLHRLQIILSWLWIVGRPMPPRPLHHQLLLSRDIFITERMDMHLVWTAGSAGSIIESSSSTQKPARVTTNMAPTRREMIATSSCRLRSFVRLRFMWG